MAWHGIASFSLDFENMSIYYNVQSSWTYMESHWNKNNKCNEQISTVFIAVAHILSVSVCVSWLCFCEIGTS